MHDSRELSVRRWENWYYYLVITPRSSTVTLAIPSVPRGGLSVSCLSSAVCGLPAVVFEYE
jgi:hypothetical protein